MEGDGLAKELTGAKVMVMAEDEPALRAMKPGGKEHPVDRVVHDGEAVTLGDTTLVAHLTPGHTRGATAWTTTATEGGKTYNVVFFASLRPPAKISPPTNWNSRGPLRRRGCCRATCRWRPRPGVPPERKVRKVETRRPQSVYRCRGCTDRTRYRRSDVRRRSGRTEGRRQALTGRSGRAARNALPKEFTMSKVSRRFIFLSRAGAAVLRARRSGSVSQVIAQQPAYDILDPQRPHRRRHRQSLVHGRHCREERQDCRHRTPDRSHGCAHHRRHGPRRDAWRYIHLHSHTELLGNTGAQSKLREGVISI